MKKFFTKIFDFSLLTKGLWGYTCILLWLSFVSREERLDWWWLPLTFHIFGANPCVQHEHGCWCVWWPVSYLSLGEYKLKSIWNKESVYLSSGHSFVSQRSTEGPSRVRDECWLSFDCVTSGWTSFMRLPACHPHITMNCEQDFGEGGLGVTLTLRLLMHGKVKSSRPHDCFISINSCCSTQALSCKLQLP